MQKLRYVLFRVEFFGPATLGALWCARQALSGWGKAVPAGPTSPLSRDMVRAISNTLQKARNVSAAYANSFGFHALLRAREICQLAPADVYFPEDFRLPEFGVKSRAC